MNTTTNQPTSISSVALSIAISQLGQQEQPKGSNTGPMVNKYLASVGLKPGYAWCQAFVHWCYGEAANLLKIANPIVKTAGVAACWNQSDKAKKYVAKALLADSSNLVPGTQFILMYGTVTGHTGIIERMEGNLMHTIEGNSNTGGGREGYEVVRHTRKLTDAALKGCIIY